MFAFSKCVFLKIFRSKARKWWHIHTFSVRWLSDIFSHLRVAADTRFADCYLKSNPEEPSLDGHLEFNSWPYDNVPSTEADRSKEQIIDEIKRTAPITRSHIHCKNVVDASKFLSPKGPTGDADVCSELSSVSHVP